MPTPIPTGFKLGIVEPREAVAAFQARSLIQTTFSWQDLWNEEHARAFTISRLTQTDLLEFMQAELAKAVATGSRLADFQKTVQPRLEDAGWWGKRSVIEQDTGEVMTTTFDPARLQLIFDVNTRQSYAAGRWARIERNKARFPFVMYRTMQDGRVRASHRPWNGVTLPVDDPFWDTHYPPCGWRCRCTAFAVDERDIARRIAGGETIKREAPPAQFFEFVNKRSGAIESVPHGIDPGFGYNPGKAGAHLAQAGKQLQTGLDGAAPDIARSIVAATVRSPEFAAFVAAPGAGQTMPVAVLAPEQAALIESRRQAVMLSGQTLAKQATAHPEIAAADYATVQRVLDAGEVLQDGPRSLIFVSEQDGMVAVVKATVSGDGLFIVSLRRLSSQEALRDAEILRLRAKVGSGR